MADVADVSETSRRVLIVGRGAELLSRVRAALAGLGVEAVTTTDPAEALRRLAGDERYAAVMTGRGVDPAARERIIEAAHGLVPRPVHVDGLGPVPPVLVAQIRRALTRPGPAGPRIGGVRAEADSVQLDLRLPGPVTVTAHRLGPGRTVTSEPLMNCPLGAGLHDVGLAGIGEEPGEVFVVVEAGDEADAFAVR